MFQCWSSRDSEGRERIHSGVEWRGVFRTSGRGWAGWVDPESQCDRQRLLPHLRRHLPVHHLQSGPAIPCGSAWSHHQHSSIICPGVTESRSVSHRHRLWREGVQSGSSDHHGAAKVSNVMGRWDHQFFILSIFYPLKKSFSWIWTSKRFGSPFDQFWKLIVWSVPQGREKQTCWLVIRFIISNQ